MSGLFDYPGAVLSCFELLIATVLKQYLFRRNMVIIAQLLFHYKRLAQAPLQGLSIASRDWTAAYLTSFLIFISPPPTHCRKIWFNGWKVELKNERHREKATLTAKCLSSPIGIIRQERLKRWKKQKQTNPFPK